MMIFRSYTKQTSYHTYQSLNIYKLLSSSNLKNGWLVPSQPPPPPSLWISIKVFTEIFYKVSTILRQN